MHLNTDPMHEKLDIVQAESQKAIAILDDLLLCQQLESDAIDIEMKEVNPFVASRSFLRDLRNKVTVKPFDGDETIAKKLVFQCDENKLRIAFNKLLHTVIDKTEQRLLQMKFSYTINSPQKRNSNSYTPMHAQLWSARIHPITDTGVFSIEIQYNSDHDDAPRVFEKIASKRLVLEREAESPMNGYRVSTLG